MTNDISASCRCIDTVSDADSPVGWPTQGSRGSTAPSDSSYDNI